MFVKYKYQKEFLAEKHQTTDIIIKVWCFHHLVGSLTRFFVTIRAPIFTVPLHFTTLYLLWFLFYTLYYFLQYLVNSTYLLYQVQAFRYKMQLLWKCIINEPHSGPFPPPHLSIIVAKRSAKTSPHRSPSAANGLPEPLNGWRGICLVQFLVSESGWRWNGGPVSLVDP